MLLCDLNDLLPNSPGPELTASLPGSSRMFWSLGHNGTRRAVFHKPFIKTVFMKDINSANKRLICYLTSGCAVFT